ncbi:SDR family NAD(P)-dependent oxidoreductase [Microbacterium sp. RD1]|uniref:SDR family NAD(P)-dependent oxidoreductase n=1 Tax=Microbacterium sp. RD1 TaxID=3457313 RepID=UPI003FA5CE12
MPTLLIVGYGPGNSHALARRFGAEGWSIALVARNEERLRDGAARLRAEGISAHPFRADAADPASLREAVSRVRDQLGPITAAALTAYRNVAVSDVLVAEPEDLGAAMRIGVSGLATLVQASLDDLRAVDDASVLVVNGGLGAPGRDIDRFAVSFDGDGVALESAAKSKLVGLLAERLRGDGIYVGEVVIAGTMQGSPYAGPTAIDPAEVADRLWTMAQERTEVRTVLAERASERESAPPSVRSLP